MKKLLAILFLISSTILSMQPEIEPALIPTIEECREQMSYCWGDRNLMEQFARYGDISHFHKYDFTFWHSNKLLNWAVDKGERGVVEILLSRNIAGTIDKKGWAVVISQALETGFDELAALLIAAKKEFDVDYSGWNRESLLHTAAWTGCVKSAAALIECGIKADTKDEHGTTPLQYALEPGVSPRTGVRQKDLRRAEPMACLLLEHGADPGVSIRQHSIGTRVGTSKLESIPFIDWCVQKNLTSCLQFLAENKHVVGRQLVKGAEGWSGEEHIVHWAARQGNIPLVAALLTAGSSINYTKDGYSALTVACRRGKEDMVAFLLAKGARIPDPADLLSWAIGHNHVGIARTAIERGGQQALKEFPLHAAAAQGYVPMIRLLLSQGLDPSAYNAWKMGGNSVLYKAVSNNHYDAAAMLLAAGANPDAGRPSALKKAVGNGNAQMCDLLLSYGADVARAEAGWHGNTSLLGMAANRQQLLPTLLAHRFDPDGVNEHEEPPLRAVFRAGNIDGAHELLRHGADPFIEDEDGNTSLHFAAGFEDADLIAQLLEAGVPLKPNKEGVTPLMRAVIQGNYETAQVLLEAGDDPHAVYTERGVSCSVFDFAACSNNRQMCQLLLYHGAAIARRNEKGNTPLHITVQCELYNAISCLVANGALWDVQNDEGKTPLDCCADSSQERLLFAVLKGLPPSISEEGLVTVEQVVNSLQTERWQGTPEVDGTQWLAALKENPFTRLRQLSTEPIFAKLCDALEEKVCRRAAHLVGRAVKRAAKKNDTQIMSTYIAGGVSLKKFNLGLGSWHSLSAMEWAAENGHIDLLRTLLERGYPVTKHSVVKAIGHSNLAAYNLLMTSGRYAPTDEDTRAIFGSAVYAGCHEVCQKLLADGLQATPHHLIEAIQAGQTSVAQLLMDSGVSVDEVDTVLARNNWQYKHSSVMRMVVASKKTDMLRFLLQHSDRKWLDQAAYDWLEGFALMLDDGPAAVQRVLQEPGSLNALLHRTESSMRPHMAKVLLDRGVRPCLATDAETFVHSVARSARDFSSGEFKQRHANISWLASWIQKHLEGHEDLAIAPQQEKLGEGHVHVLPGMMDAFFVLMTHPVYENPQEHKSKVKQLLGLKALIGQQEQKVSPFELAQQRGTSTTFNKLFDPKKIKQWYPVIDRAYAKKATLVL